MPRRSQAWKSLEREAAKLMGGTRVSRGSDFSASDVDVKVSDLPFLRVDCKYRKSHAHHSLVEEIQEKYCKRSEDVPVLITKSHRQTGCNVTIPGYFFNVLLDAFRQLNCDPDLPHVPKNKVMLAKGVSPSEIEVQDRGLLSAETNEPECDCGACVQERTPYRRRRGILSR